MKRGLIILIFLLAILVASGILLFNSQKKIPKFVQQGYEKVIGKSKCKGTKVKFNHAPVNLEKILVLQPLGLMTGNHVTPIDHHYFQNFDNKEYNIEVYSPGDGYITSIEGGHGENRDEYRFTIEHTCTISSTYIYIADLPEKIKAFAPVSQRYVNVRIPVKAGELLGYFKTNLDYNLVDKEVTLQGFVVPKHYEGEPWKIHVPNTYNYFNEPVKSEMIAKSLRTVEPISGKIDYDIDGRLVGNWFLQGTNGYARDATQRERYGEGHLAIVYDAYDPKTVVFSIGGYEGRDSEQFAVKGNSPDPANVDVSNGLVKYELVHYEYFSSEGNRWDRKSLVKGLTTKPADNVQGVVLVQMIEDRKLKFEVFPGKTADTVSGFSGNAKIYER